MNKSNLVNNITQALILVGSLVAVYLGILLYKLLFPANYTLIVASIDAGISEVATNINYLLFATWVYINLLFDTTINWFQQTAMPVLLPYKKIVLDNSLTVIIAASALVIAVLLFRDIKDFFLIFITKKYVIKLEQIIRIASGAIANDEGTNQTRLSLQISALHSLRAFISSKYPNFIRRKAFETIRTLAIHNHRRVLSELKRQDFKSIQEAIQADPLCKELNTILEQDWYNFLINHNFNTNSISLVGVRLQNKNLGKTWFKKLSLNNCDMRGVDLTGSDISGASLVNSNLQNSILTETNLSKVNAQKADFSQVSCCFANFNSANLIASEWLITKALGANFSNCKMQDILMYKVNLSGGKLNNSILHCAALYESKLFGCDIKSSDFKAANLAYSRFSGAIISKCNFNGVAENNVVGKGKGTAKFSDRAVIRINKMATFGTTVFSGGYSNREFLQDDQLLKYMTANNFLANKKYQQWRNRVLHNVGSTARFVPDNLLKCKVSYYNERQSANIISAYKKLVLSFEF